jgi:hypothetical protein
MACWLSALLSTFFPYVLRMLWLCEMSWATSSSTCRIEKKIEARTSWVFGCRCEVSARKEPAEPVWPVASLRLSLHKFSLSQNPSNAFRCCEPLPGLASYTIGKWGSWARWSLGCSYKFRIKITLTATLQLVGPFLHLSALQIFELWTHTSMLWASACRLYNKKGQLIHRYELWAVAV